MNFTILTQARQKTLVTEMFLSYLKQLCDPGSWFMIRRTTSFHIVNVTNMVRLLFLANCQQQQQKRESFTMSINTLFVHTNIFMEGIILLLYYFLATFSRISQLVLFPKLPHSI